MSQQQSLSVAQPQSEAVVAEAEAVQSQAMETKAVVVVEVEALVDDDGRQDEGLRDADEGDESDQRLAHDGDGDAVCLRSEDTFKFKLTIEK